MECYLVEHRDKFTILFLYFLSCCLCVTFISLMLVTDREFLGRGCGNTGTKDTVQVGVGVSKGTRKKQ
jgi:hypothetical protein